MDRLQKAKIIAARTYTSLKCNSEKSDNTNFDGIWNMLSSDTQQWALNLVDELEM